MFRFHPDQLKLKEKLGAGRFGTVFSYKKEENDLKWAVKRIIAGDADALVACFPEIVFGYACNHPSVVPVKRYFIQKDSSKESYDLYMKLPRMKETLLDEFKKRKRDDKSYSEQEVTRHFYSIACGLEYLHDKKIYHGDIKPDNLLLDEKGTLSIGDIGIAKHVEEEDSDQTLTGQIGTYQYIAPELLGADRKKIKKHALAKADIWGMGVVIMELCVFDFRLLNALDGEKIRKKIEEHLKSLDGKFPKSLIGLISKTLSLVPDERPTTEEIKIELEKNFAQNLDQELLKMSNSHKISMETKYKAEIDALHQQIRETLAESQILKETLSEKEKVLDKYKGEKEEEISQLKLNLCEQKEQYDARIKTLETSERISNQQRGEADSNLESDLSKQKKHYENKIKALEKQKSASLFERFSFKTLISISIFIFSFLFITEILGYQSQESFQQRYDLKYHLSEIVNNETKCLEISTNGQDCDERINQTVWKREVETAKNAKDLLPKFSSLLSDKINLEQILFFMKAGSQSKFDIYANGTILCVHPREDVERRDITDEDLIAFLKETTQMIQNKNLVSLSGFNISCEKCEQLTSEVFVHLKSALTSTSLSHLDLNFQECEKLNDTALEHLGVAISPHHLDLLFLNVGGVPLLTINGIKSFLNGIKNTPRPLKTTWSSSLITDEVKRLFKERIPDFEWI